MAKLPEQSRTTGTTAGWWGLLLSCIPWIGVVGLVVATAIDLLTGDRARVGLTLLQNAILWLVGVQGFIIGSGHIFVPDPIADSIGWPRGSPFQFEVGLASISYGVLGVVASTFGPQWWLAAIVAFSVFYLGAAVGHVRELIVEHNPSPGNAGSILVFDVLVPLFLILLWVVVKPA
jgi:hypothetical protein